ncbi:MAG TPA: diacylglycerol kinase family protein [Gemmatimonadales bacterium]|nr:diacylglycerol kinase family protein [Gemmatimonadales bacterium]
MAVPAFINPHGGSAGAAADALRHAGGFAVREAAPDTLAALLGEEVRQGARRVLVAGGDGTIAAAASVLAGTPVELAVVPGGTLNHFARHHGIPTDAIRAVEAAQHGAVRPVDVAYVNDRLFINTSSVGAYVRFVRTRDRLQSYVGYRVASVLAACRTLTELHSLHVRVDLRGEAIVYQTPLLFVGVGERSLAPTSLGAPRPGGARALHVAALRGRRQAWRFARTYARGASVHPRADEPVAESAGFLIDSVLVDHCRVEVHRDRLNVAQDGEITRMQPPLDFRLARDALRIVVPAGGAGPGPCTGPVVHPLY